MVQFNAPFAHVQPTPGLYILLQFFVDLWFGTCDAGTLADKQCNAIIVLLCSLYVQKRINHTYTLISHENDDSMST